MADIPGNTSTTSVLSGTGVYFSSLETANDSDWWRVNAVAGLTYDFTLSGDGGPNSLDDAMLVLRDSAGNQIDYISVWDGQAQTISLTATSAGPFYLDVVDARGWDDLAEGSYRLTARMHDLLVNNATTTAALVNGTLSGALEASGDSDWYRVTLTAGQTVDFQLSGDGSVTSLDYGTIILRDGNGNQLEYATSRNGSPARVWHDVTTSGTYYIEVRDSYSDRNAEGSFRLTSRLSDSVPGNTDTKALLRDGSVLDGVIDAATDNDWVRFEAVAGRTYRFSLTGDGSNAPLDGSILELRDNSGTRLAYDYGYGPNGAAVVTLTATRTGSYYLDISGQGSDDWGGYRLSVLSDTPVLSGTAGNDVLTGGSPDNLIEGFAGNDSLNGGTGNDTLVGGMGNDTLIGGEGTDRALFATGSGSRVHLSVTTPQNTLHGRDVISGIENLTGGAGTDIFVGDMQANDLRGEGGNDQLYGGGGGDTLIGGAGNDYLHGGANADWAVFSGPQAVVVEMRRNLVTGQGNDTIAGIENIETGTGNDRIIGNAHRNELSGGAGNDTVAGGGAADVLTGGAGADRFVFADYEGSDRILDFQDGLDRIVIGGGRTDGFSDLTITNSTFGAAVSWGAGTTITLNGIDASSLSAADFVFD